MKISAQILLAIASLTMLSSCVQPSGGGGSVASRSGHINASSSDPRTMVSEQRLSQNRRQRANVLEDSSARRQLREDDRDETLGGLKTFREGMGLMNGITGGARSTAWNVRNF